MRSYPKIGKLFQENSSNPLERGDNEEIGHEDIETIYEFYVVLDYDDNGELHINEVKGLSNTFFHNEIVQKAWERQEKYAPVGNYRALKNVVFIYGIQKEVYNSNSGDDYDRIANYMEV